jgi:uncharacterized RDD family membrane protein YckC
MALCSACRAESPAGARWCPICHRHALKPEAGSLASPGRRLAAYLADVAIPIFAFFVIFGTAGAGVATGSDAGVGLAGFLAVGLMLGYIVWAFKLFANGYTPGKKTLGLRVVREDGNPAGFGAMLIREWIGKWISGVLFGLGYFWMLWDKDRQGLHDKLLSTYVVQPAAITESTPLAAV